MKRIIYVDMDDTLCDYTTDFLRMNEQNPAIKFPQATYGFFTNLKPIEGAIEGIKKLAEVYDVWILTKPSVRNPLCYTEKRVWVENHLGMDWCHRLIISPNKALLKGDYLIDDWKHPGFEGEHIHFGTDYKNWNEVLEYLNVK